MIDANCGHHCGIITLPSMPPLTYEKHCRCDECKCTKVVERCDYCNTDCTDWIHISRCCCDYNTICTGCLESISLKDFYEKLVKT